MNIFSYKRVCIANHSTSSMNKCLEIKEALKDDKEIKMIGGYKNPTIRPLNISDVF